MKKSDKFLLYLLRTSYTYRIEFLELKYGKKSLEYNGLCSQIRQMYLKDLITFVEMARLSDIICKKYEQDGGKLSIQQYWWPVEDTKARIEFLSRHIGPMPLLQLLRYQLRCNLIFAFRGFKDRLIKRIKD